MRERESRFRIAQYLSLLASVAEVLEALGVSAFLPTAWQTFCRSFGEFFLSALGQELLSGGLSQLSAFSRFLKAFRAKKSEVRAGLI